MTILTVFPDFSDFPNFSYQNISIFKFSPDVSTYITSISRVLPKLSIILVLHW